MRDEKDTKHLPVQHEDIETSDPKDSELRYSNGAPMY